MESKINVHINDYINEINRLIKNAKEIQEYLIDNKNICPNNYKLRFIRNIIKIKISLARSLDNKVEGNFITNDEKELIYNTFINQIQYNYKKIINDYDIINNLHK
jgi:hypothetical protein